MASIAQRSQQRLAHILSSLQTETSSTEVYVAGSVSVSPLALCLPLRAAVHMWRAVRAAARSHCLSRWHARRVPEIHLLDVPDPNSLELEFSSESGRAGNSPLGNEVQGLQIIKHHPPPFDPNTQADEAFEFYRQNGYCVITALSEQELTDLNAVADNFRKYDENHVDVGPAELFFPLLGYPEFDFTFFHPNTLPLVQRILGGVDVPRLIECNYRAWNGPESGYHMGFHPDDCSGGLLTLEQRQTRVPYGPPDMLSTFTYLTDVDETNPSFAVIPKSRRIDNLQVLSDVLGDEYGEVPIHGPAGTCCIVDRSTIHTRLDPLETDKSKQQSRRLYHHVFARAGELYDANGVLREGNGEPLSDAPPRSLAPRRLVESEDPYVAQMFSVLSTTQKEWMATGWDEEYINKFKSAWGGL
jgi:hypothetical protein